MCLASIWQVGITRSPHGACGHPSLFSRGQSEHQRISPVKFATPFSRCSCHCGRLRENPRPMLLFHGFIGMWPKLSRNRKPHSDKTSCALGAPPCMKIESACNGVVNRLISVGVEAIFIAVGGLNGSMQHSLEVFFWESTRLITFASVDSKRTLSCLRFN
jgi:hypothetical protein